MSEAVFDATVIRCTNRGLIDSSKKEAALEGIRSLQEFTVSDRKVRFNAKLRSEYDGEQTARSDLMANFITILDSPRGIPVKENRLRNSDFVKSRECLWPPHDQHLLAAAMNGIRVRIYVSEAAHYNQAAEVKRRFGFSVVRISLGAAVLK